MNKLGMLICAYSPSTWEGVWDYPGLHSKNHVNLDHSETRAGKRKERRRKFTNKQFMVVYTYNPSTWETELGESWLQSQPGLNREASNWKNNSTSKFRTNQFCVSDKINMYNDLSKYLKISVPNST